jgi:glutathione S-transferase
MQKATVDLDVLVVGVPGSHPTAAVEKALELKGLAFRRVDRIPVAHIPQQRLLYGRGTVPAVRIGGQRLVGSETIFRFLDTVSPNPALFPADRPEVVDQAKWAEAALQDVARRIVWAGLRERPAAIAAYATQAKMPLPTGLALWFARPVIRAEIAVHGARVDTVRRDVDGLNATLDRADAIIEAWRVGGSPPDAAVLQIASSVALLATIRDLDDLLDGRSSQQAARALFSDTPGHLPLGALRRLRAA